MSTHSAGSLDLISLMVVEGRLIQDWITIRGQIDATVVTQGSSGWLDVGEFEDIALFLDVRQVSSPGPPQLTYETAPAKQEALFMAMRPAFPMAIGLRVDRIFTATSAVPPARWVRWSLAHGANQWSATFRIWVAGFAWRRA